MTAPGQVDGASEVSQALQQVKERLQQALASGAYMVANEVMTDAKERCPVDTGTLRASGYVALPEVIDDQVSVEIGFGGPAAPYAAPVHEKTEVKHPVGEAKFLENAVNAHATDVPQRIAEIAKQALEG